MDTNARWEQKPKHEQTQVPAVTKRLNQRQRGSYGYLGVDSKFRLGITTSIDRRAQCSRWNAISIWLFNPVSGQTRNTDIVYRFVQQNHRPANVLCFHGHGRNKNPKRIGLFVRSSWTI